MMRIKCPSKNLTGFSLIEVTLAVLIVGVLLTAIFGLQNNLFSRTRYQHQQVSAELALDNLLQDEKFVKELLEQKSIKRELTEPLLELTASSQNLADQAVAENWPEIKVLKLSGSWTEPYKGQRQVDLVGLIYTPKTMTNEKQKQAQKSERSAALKAALLAGKSGGKSSNKDSQSAESGSAKNSGGPDMKNSPGGPKNSAGPSSGGGAHV